MSRLFGLAIMTARHRGLGSLHGVLLPRTWILALWEDFFSRRFSALPDLKNKAPNFSKDIPPKYLQDLCVARMFNFSAHRKNVVQVAAFHGRYIINSWHWAGLAEALYLSTTSPFDDLVRLRLESSPISGPQIPGVDLITFRDMNSIPILLRSRPGGHPITTIVSNENTGAPHAAVSGQVTDGIDGTGDLSGFQHVEEAAEYSADDAVDTGDGDGPDRSKETLMIQRAVRRYLLKPIEGSSDDKLKTGRDRLFKACKASADAVHTGYRKIYLGPLPHLLLCLEWIISSTRASKATIKARRRGATLQKLSDLMLQQTQMNDILKEARELQKRLGPESSLHPQAHILDAWDAARDLEPLRSAVTKASDLFERLSDPRFPTVEVPTVEFELAWNGIMPSKLRKFRSYPTHNV
ncbi:hypothetical protein BJY52DRAFT_1288038 [Lactarius psammicola]|nr:hypothetical protein BJY52DRAFT_1288038 [Lactarius psammicola]